MNKVIALDIGDVCLRRRLDISLNAFGLNNNTELPQPVAFAVDQYETRQNNAGRMGYLNAASPARLYPGRGGVPGMEYDDR